MSNTKSQDEVIQQDELDTEALFLAASKEFDESEEETADNQSSTAPTEPEEETPTDDGDSTEDNTEVGSDQTDAESTEETVGTEGIANEAAQATDAPNWEDMYKQSLQNTQQLQQQMMQLSQQVQASQQMQQAAPAPDQDQSKKEVSEFKMDETLVELYPELIDPINSMIEHRVSQAVQQAEEKMSQRLDQDVRPIAARVQEAEAQAYETAIFSAHPDAMTHVQSGALRGWIDGLPEYQQAGAKWVCTHGTADQFIQLMNEYKVATGATSQKAATPAKSDATNEKVTNSNSKQTVRENSIANQAVNALFVPSDKEQVTTSAGNTSPDNDDMDALFAKAAKDLMTAELL